MNVPILAPARRLWHCPNCGQNAVSNEPRVHTQFHHCSKLRGLWSPMLPAGVKGKVELHEREDYIGREQVQLDPERKRPVMSVVTTRDDGQDTVVYAPTATAEGDT